MSVVRPVVGDVVRDVVRSLIGREDISFLLTSTGDGTGVSTLSVNVNKDTIFTFVDGAARFYSDAGGTLGESTTWLATAGGARTRYIKCTTGVSNMTLSNASITLWALWTSGANAASISGDIGQLTALTYVDIQGNNTISGDISGLASLTYLDVRGSNTISGSIAGLTSLTNLTLYGFNTVSGSINALTSINSFFIIAGLNTVTGDVSLISTNIVYCSILGSNQIVTYTAGGDWGSIADGWSVVRVSPAGGYGLDEDEVDLFIIEVEDTRSAGFAMHLTLTGSNAARTAASDAAVAAIIADGGTVTTN